MIPDYQTLMLPVLKLAANGEVSISDAVNAATQEFGLSDTEQAELLPSGKLTVIRSRVHWAKAYLKQAGLIEATKRGHFRATPAGSRLLAEGLGRIDNAVLRRFPEFQSFLARGKESSSTHITDPLPSEEATPEEVLRDA